MPEDIYARDPMTVPYTYITTTDAAVAALEEMADAELVAVDTETEVLPGSDLDRDGPGPWVVLSAAARFADGSEKTWVINMTDVDAPALAEPFSHLEPYAWNAAFERRVFARDGIRVTNWRDPMLFEAVLRQGCAADGKPFYKGLAAVASSMIGAQLGGKGDVQLSFRRGVELTEEQKAYAAQDAIVVVWLEPLLRARLEEAGLFDTALRECGALGAFQDFNLNGIWLDRDGWLAEVAKHAELARDAETKLALMTSGGQANLFDSSVETTWKPGNPADVRRILNEYHPDEVRAYTAANDRDGKARLLGPADSVDHDALELIGGEIAEVLLARAEHQKVVTTYGADFCKQLHDDGKFHARYLQALTATGRASSDRPNFQNLTPLMKRFLLANPHPTPVHELSAQECLDAGLDALYVFVAVDLSQAELRKLAFESGDAALIEAYRNGEDLHLVTAARMFGRDISELKAAYAASEQWAVEMRAKGKTLNFGVVYGLSAGALAKRLTVAGVPTDINEGRELLKLYDKAYPGVAAWLAERDAFIDALAENPPEFDWDKTWFLHREFRKVKSAKFRFRDRTGKFPTDDELVAELAASFVVSRHLERSLGREPLEAEVAAAEAEARERILWVRSFDAPVVLLADGTPFRFESRTSAGRRRVFEVSTDEWLDSMMQIAARTNKSRAAAVRDEWAAMNNSSLTMNVDGRTKVLSREALKKRFEGARGRAAKESFVEHVIDAMGPQAAAYLMRSAVSDCIRGAKRQYRNHPIQGGVADAVEDALGLLDVRLPEVGSAEAVQSVHDSFVARVEVRKALLCAEVIQTAMEEGLANHCGDVPVVADIEILVSLDPKRHTLSDDELSALCATADRLDELLEARSEELNAELADMVDPADAVAAL